ncbi:MAG: hypothetical protein QNK17_02910 [Hyphomicrobiaceae bacterium]|jgi:hypothetical protein|nr:hypothetical protein [Methyloceanibacter sp.]MDX2317345.1 hypothetical protein [Hyphomicrobiaceae bacterium]MDX2449367.1 hypothetical protein [Hyphomicrobiaceae bacterium]
MDTCTSGSAIQLLVVAMGYLLAVLSLDMFWVQSSSYHNDIASALRKRSWLNAFVAFGAIGAVVMLCVWVQGCGKGAF